MLIWCDIHYTDKLLDICNMYINILFFFIIGLYFALKGALKNM